MTGQKKRVTAIKARAARGIKFEEALRQCAKLLSNAVSLLYTPQWCGFAQFDAAEGKLVAADGKSADQFADNPDEFASSVFEARVFNKQVELRWLHESEGKGRAVLLSDDGEDVNLDDYLSDVSQPTEWPKLNQIIKTLPQTYLLWGEGVKRPNDLFRDWSRLTTARIGRLHVPIQVDEKRRVHLIAKEYLAQVDDHGNVAVVDERLIALEQV
jgi:CRISPR-associated protein (TIGR03984 family)